MSKRPFSTPPVIDGFEWLRNLGLGGFADVFLYQRLHPRSEVAIKVLLRDKMTTKTVSAFTEEANMMAQFAGHPSIVSVYQAGVAADGRPYLVMEYCPRLNLQERHRLKRFSEIETLQVGVQIASAVETAHQAGVLHRDIKPANILGSKYGDPKLSDFGISAAAGGAQQMEGLSILWAPPEVLNSTRNSSPASDVYSLAATLYTLLANRSPFEIPGASNEQVDVVDRIHRMPMPSLGSGVSASLESVLRRAMSKDPADRPQTAMEFALALNRVQIEHNLQPTQVQVSREQAAAFDVDDKEDATNIKPPRVIDAQPAADGGTAQIGATNLHADETNLHTDAQQSTSVSDETHLADAATMNPRPVGTGSVTHAQPYTPTGPYGSVATPPDAAPQHFERSAVSTAAGSAAPERPQHQAPDHSSPYGGPPPLSLGQPTPAVARPRPRIRRSVVVGAVTAVVVLAATAAIGYATLVAPQPGSQADGAPTSAPVPLDAAQPVDVVDLKGTTTAGTVTFTWTNPAPRAGDTYLWRPVVPGESFTFEPVITPSVSVPPAQSGRTCIEVLLVRDGGGAPSEGVQGCAP